MGAQATVNGGGVFTKSNISDINNNFSTLFAGFTPGNIVYCNPSGTGVSNPDGSAQKPYTDLVTAYNVCRNGMNDVVLLVGNGASSGSARITANFAWAKDSTHLFGICSPSLYGQRARIAPTSNGAAFANFFTLTANGCVFQNVEFIQSFATGTTAQICLTLTGATRNVFKNCQIAGMGDAASAQDTGSRSLKISGGGENVFEDCVIGLDTVARTVANASLELANGTPRNTFRRCIFPFFGTSATVIGILGTGAACMDRGNLFQGCLFINDIKSTSTQMTALVNMTSASPGGALVFDALCGMMGITKVGDTNGLANSYILGAAPSNSAGMIGVNPT